MLGNVRVSMELNNAPDKEGGNPRLHNSIACLPLYARYHALEHVFKMDMLEVYFPMSDLPLLVRTAKCANLLNASRLPLPSHKALTPGDFKHSQDAPSTHRPGNSHPITSFPHMPQVHGYKRFIHYPIKGKQFTRK